jgi:hypothetical protein
MDRPEAVRARLRHEVPTVGEPAFCLPSGRIGSNLVRAALQIWRPIGCVRYGTKLTDQALEATFAANGTEHLQPHC